MSANPDTPVGLEGHVVELADGSELEILFTPRRLRILENVYQSLEAFLAALRAQPIQNISWVIALHQRSATAAPPTTREVDRATDLIASARFRDYSKAIGDAVADGLGGTDPALEFHQALAQIEHALPHMEPAETVDWIRSVLEELRAAVPVPPPPPAPGRNGSRGVGTSTSRSQASTSTRAPSGMA